MTRSAQAVLASCQRPAVPRRSFLHTCHLKLLPRGFFPQVRDCVVSGFGTGQTFTPPPTSRAHRMRTTFSRCVPQSLQWPVEVHRRVRAHHPQQPAGCAVAVEARQRAPIAGHAPARPRGGCTGCAARAAGVRVAVSMSSIWWWCSWASCVKRLNRREPVGQPGSMPPTFSPPPTRPRPACAVRRSSHPARPGPHFAHR